MELLLIIALILFGVLFLVAELVLLPGVSVGGILSLICFGSSIYMAFHELGTEAGITATLVCLVLAAAGACLRGALFLTVFGTGPAVRIARLRHVRKQAERIPDRVSAPRFVRLLAADQMRSVTPPTKLNCSR